MSLRMVQCQEVLRGSKPVTPLPRVAVHAGNVAVLLHAAVCDACHEQMILGGRVKVRAMGAEPLADDGWFYVWRAAPGATKPEPEPEPSPATEPSHVYTVRVINGYRVELFREPRLRERELAKWALRMANGELAPVAFARIVDAVKAGPPEPTPIARMREQQAERARTRRTWSARDVQQAIDRYGDQGIRTRFVKGVK